MVVTPECRYPGCERPCVPPSVYCDLERHNPGSADQKRRRDRQRSERQAAARLLGERSELLDGTLLLHDVITRGHALSGTLASLAGELAAAVTQITDPGALDEALEAVREQARQQIAETNEHRAEAQAAARRARVEANRSADDAREARERIAAATRAAEHAVARAQQADSARRAAERASDAAEEAADTAQGEAERSREAAEHASSRAAAAEASLGEIRGQLDRATAAARLAEDSAADLSGELASTRERLLGAEHLATREPESRERVELELTRTQAHAAVLADTQQQTAAAAAAAEGRATALTEERDALRVELAEVRRDVERARREARARLERLAGGGASRARAGWSSGSARWLRCATRGSWPGRRVRLTAPAWGEGAADRGALRVD